MAPYATLTDARAAWRESEKIADTRLEDLLTIAAEQITPYALPADLAAVPVPRRLVEANVRQAQELYAVAVSSTGDVIGFDAYALRRRPLPDSVRALLRPTTGPVLG